MKRQIIFFMLMLGIAIPSYAQMVYGRIFDTLDDEPLEGAQVWYKDRPAGKVVADENGYYKIRFRPGTLVFHYFGYKDVEVVVKKARSLDIKLSMDSKEMGAITVKAEKKKYVLQDNTESNKTPEKKVYEHAPVYMEFQLLVKKTCRICGQCEKQDLSSSLL